MSRSNRRRTMPRAGQLFRPLALEGSVEGLLFAIVCALGLGTLYLVDVGTPGGITLGSLGIIPLIAASWLLSRRLTVAITLFAILLRLVAVSQGGIHLGTGAAEAVSAVILAFIARVAAEQFANSEQQAARAALVSRIARIATSSDRLNLILYGVLDEMARAGFEGGLIALLDERNELYPAAVEGAVDRQVMEGRLLAVAPLMDRATSEGRSLLIPDASRTKLSDGGRQLQYRPISVVVVPLRAAGNVVGALELDSPQRRRFNETDTILLEQIALAISGAVQRTGALQLADEQLRRRLKDLSLLLETARTLSSSLDLEHILREVVHSSADLVSHGGRQGVRASLFKIEGGTATFLADYDEMGVRLAHQSFPVNQHKGIVRAIETGRAATWDFKEVEEPLASIVRRTNVLSGAFAPLRTGNALFGVLSAASRDEREFDPEELRLLEGIADLAGLAISNAQRLGLEMSRAQQLRAHAERMQGLEKTKSEFLRLASHELRGPIAILRGYISMLNDGTLGELPEQTRRVLPMLTEKTSEMNHLIEQMLETARLEDTRLQLHLELVDLKEILLESIKTLQNRAKTGGCHIVTELKLPALLANGGQPLEGPDLSQGTKVSVLADPERIGTVLINLIDNAIKYSPEGGEIRCTLWLDEGRAKVAVSDQGLGIDSADLPRLFTRFGRIVTPENSHIPGTGLGLYLSRELARMHGGDIVVGSEPGQGSTFTLSLPVAMERLHRLAAPQAEPESVSPPLVGEV